MESQDRITESLERLADTMNNKYQNTLIVSSTKTSFFQQLTPPIELDPKRTYKAAVKSFSVYNSIRNVRKDINDTFRYSKDNGATWTNIIIFPGSYNAMDIINEIYRQAGLSADNSNLKFTPDIKTNTIIMLLGTNYKVDFSVAHNMHKIFGFNEVTYSAGTHRSPLKPTIIDFHNILLKTNLISGGYVGVLDASKLKPNNIIYSLPTFTVPIGSKIIESIPTPVWHNIILKPIDIVQFEVINENGDPIDFGGEELSITILIRQV